jgi:TPR repeat protein
MYEMARYYTKRYEREDMCEIEFLRNFSKLLKEAADAGLPEAQYLLASDIWWEDRDFDVCLDLLKKAASKGHEYSMELVNRSSKENKKIPFPQW